MTFISLGICALIAAMFIFTVAAASAGTRMARRTKHED